MNIQPSLKLIIVWYIKFLKPNLSRYVNKTIPFANRENHENPIIIYENHYNHENQKNPLDNYESNQNQEIS